MLHLVLAILFTCSLEFVHHFSTGAGVTIAIIDTGVYDHPYFNGTEIEKYDVFTNGPDVLGDVCDHGTGVAGVVYKIAPDVKIMSVRVYKDQCKYDLEGMANGIRYAANNGANIISLTSSFNVPYQPVADAIDYAVSKGILVFTSAGNTGNDSPVYPAWYNDAIVVGGTDYYDSKYYKSSWGRNILVAPAYANVPALGDKIKLKNGTSYSTPYVAATAALLLTNHSAKETIDILEKTAVDFGGDGFDEVYGYGKVDYCRAILFDKHNIIMPLIYN